MTKHPLGTVAELEEGAIDALGDAIGGDLVLPDHEDYDDTRNVWNGLANKYPAVVVRAAGGSDVARAVGFARENGLEVAIRGGSHHQTGAAMVDNGLVVDLGGMDGIDVDPETQVARVGPGARAEDVLAETQEHGLATPTGSAGDVGIPGSTLGGGIGWIRRKHGLAVDALRRVEIVTPDGELREASPERNEDLYWAVRGGGGNFGVVTDFEFELYDVGPIVGGLGVFYPAEHTGAVMETHREVIEDAPEELTTILLSGHVPNLPPIPDELAGQDAVAILGCYAGDPEEGMEVMAPLREVTEPLIDMSEPMPYEVLHDLGTQMYPWGRNYVHRSVFVDELTDEIHDVVAEQTAAAPGALDAIGVWPLGGNVGCGADSAFAWADKQYMITVEANWEHYDNESELEWAREADRRLRDAGGEGAYSGFTGIEQQEWEDWADQAYGDNYARLADIKARYDPSNVFHHNVNIVPADRAAVANSTTD